MSAAGEPALPPSTSTDTSTAVNDTVDGTGAAAASNAVASVIGSRAARTWAEHSGAEFEPMESLNSINPASRFQFDQPSNEINSRNSAATHRSDKQALHRHVIRTEPSHLFCCPECKRQNRWVLINRGGWRNVRQFRNATEAVPIRRDLVKYQRVCLDWAAVTDVQKPLDHCCRRTCVCSIP